MRIVSTFPTVYDVLLLSKKTQGTPTNWFHKIAVVAYHIFLREKLVSLVNDVHLFDVQLFKLRHVILSLKE